MDFIKTPGIEVIILYPSGKVSALQEKQLTTLGHNITALEVEGSFDDCQALVKSAFVDQDITNEIQLSSANSINIARLIPQSFYYFRALQQLPASELDSVFVVPSGNFGNLTAGMFAYKMGLPIDRFVAATNVNDIVPSYLKTGIFTPKPSIPTISNAMDVGNPSNFSRMMDLFEGDHDRLSELLKGYAFTDEETRGAILQLYAQNGYMLDPHGAVGYLASQAYLKSYGAANCIVLETAHPAKFLNVMNPLIEGGVEIPERLSILKDREKKAVQMKNSYPAFKSWLKAFAL